MAHPAYLREKARSLRVEKRLSLDEIAERLALPKTTIYYSVRDLPLGRARKATPGRRLGNHRMQLTYRARREAAYEDGRTTFPELSLQPAFRDFVCLYIAEGYKRDRNTVSICNSDLAVMKLSRRWLIAFSHRPLVYALQYHADQDLQDLRQYWGRELGIDPEIVRVQRKTNSGRLGGRNWRSAHGVLNIATYDTLFRARLQGWIDCLQERWLDSPVDGA